MDDERPLLLCRPDRVGDVIIATSCLEAIRAQRPGQRVVFAAREAMRPLLEGHPLLAGFVAVSDHPRPLAEDFRRWNACAYVGFHPDPSAQSAARLAAIPRRIGYRRGVWPDRTLTDRFDDRRDRGEKHEAEYNFDLLAPLGIRPTLPLRPSVHLPEPWRVSLRVRLTAAGWEDFDAPGGAPYAVVNPAAFAHDLRWPAENFAWLARELLHAGLFERVVLVADSVNDPSVHQIRRMLGPTPGLVDLSGATNLAELGWLLRFAGVLVSRNTGTTHLASAVGCPTVELFGRLEPRYGPARWRALGERIEVVACPPARRRWNEGRRAFWRRGHAAIPREDVLAAVRRLAHSGPV
ncbi:MAG: glycosyltransferase family 9 protein [Gluconacetobacter diazotrophicus]|nr:glycosyltransferase family 9 protein [Gluconacetobacter diazotrophicus]